MQSETIKQLLRLNRLFYHQFGTTFSETRKGIQPGMRKIVNLIPARARLLDLGCGNGRFWLALMSHTFQGEYLGLEASAPLLREARNLTSQLPENINSTFVSTPEFIQGDLMEDDWPALLPFQTFDVIVCFAVLHHIPGFEQRLKLCKRIRTLLKEDGFFSHSVWQFMNSPRLRSRTLPWDTIGLTPQEVDENDYLLDWRQGGTGVRYVHLFSEEELGTLAAESDFHIQETFYADGKEGNLGLYQIWKPA